MAYEKTPKSDEEQLKLGEQAKHAVAQSEPRATSVHPKMWSAVSRVSPSTGNSPTNIGMALPIAVASLAAQKVAFKSVIDARSLIEHFQAKPVSPTTAHSYKVAVERMLEDSSADAGIYADVTDLDLWTSALIPSTSNANSFRYNRSAIRWELQTRIARLLKAQDHDQRLYGHTSVWSQKCAYLQELMKTLQIIKAWNRDDLVPGSSAKRGAKKSKRSDLKKIELKQPDWRALMRNASEGTVLEDAVLVLDLMGCRPCELIDGVKITISGPDRFCMKVLHGAKVTKSAGQPWREIYLDIDVMPPTWRAKVAASGAFEVKISSVGKLRNRLQRMTKKVMPGMPYVTAYVYRHAFASRMREEGFSAEEIAAMMGHTVAETQTLYGIRGRGKRKLKSTVKTVVAFEAPLPIKPLDRSGLDRFVKKPKPGNGPKA